MSSLPLVVVEWHAYLKVAAGLQNIAEGFRVRRLYLQFSREQQGQHSSSLPPLLIAVILELILQITCHTRQTASIRLGHMACLVQPCWCALHAGPAHTQVCCAVPRYLQARPGMTPQRVQRSTARTTQPAGVAVHFLSDRQRSTENVQCSK